MDPTASVQIIRMILQLEKEALLVRQLPTSRLLSLLTTVDRIKPALFETQDTSTASRLRAVEMAVANEINRRIPIPPAVAL